MPGLSHDDHRVWLTIGQPAPGYAQLDRVAGGVFGGPTQYAVENLVQSFGVGHDWLGRWAQAHEADLGVANVAQLVDAGAG
jgi:hypothetical protein